MGELLVEKSDFIATITLNRPERLNAISVPMLAALSEALVDADKDPDVRVVILTGAGRGFCAGLDLQELLYEDFKAHRDAYPWRIWDKPRPDPNIDQRRCQNQVAFFRRHARELPGGNPPGEEGRWPRSGQRARFLA